jgi:predicted homoserine dehydrogenase-like protein
MNDLKSNISKQELERNGRSNLSGSERSLRWIERLRRRPSDICVTITGAGTTGKGLLHQVTTTPGFQCVVFADHNLEKAMACAEQFNVSYQVAKTRAEMKKAIDQGELAICENGMLAARCEQADAFIDATGAIGEAGRFVGAAIETGTHVAMMNAEADLAFGPHLMQRADEEGVTYTSIDGDQHGVIRRLVDKIELWGFDLVMAGNMKGYLDRYANPTSIIPEADKRDFDYRMCTSFTDGTKLCVEMALLANALGLETSVPGMHGPRADHVTEVPNVFALEEMYDEHGAVVDYVLGAEPGGGVFVVGYSDDPYLQDEMQTYKMGEGPFYVFYRPYHLCHIEALQSVAEAVLDGRSILRPDQGFQTNVYAYAKKDLKAGETLDGIGGYCCYGLIENTSDQSNRPGVPICLIDGVEVTRDVSQDEKILASDVRIDSERPDVQMYSKARGTMSEGPASLF